MRLYLILFIGLASVGFGPAGDPCLTCHGNTAPAASSAAPELPNAYSMRWDMYEFASATQPPVAEIPTPNQVIHGATYYDWSRQSMTEIYREQCIDIFSDGHDFPCQFTSIRDKTYFVRFAKDAPHEAASCCTWSPDPFWAPRPDVLGNMSFDRNMAYGSRPTQWWALNIPMPGPFGYGVDDRGPVAFWFPVISGWVQQVFRHFDASTPDAKAFDLPAICQAPNLPVCAQ